MQIVQIEAKTTFFRIKLFRLTGHRNVLNTEIKSTINFDVFIFTGYFVSYLQVRYWKYIGHWLGTEPEVIRADGAIPWVLGTAALENACGRTYLILEL